ncbi:MAG: phosphopyruvate hydratase [Planctomycetota bacterium]|nr:phosphopyruvate hydratase [Planctomycetota bacterium]
MSHPTKITHVHAREVLDSRGKPTVEVEVHCGPHAVGRAIVPSGASTGQFEAHELRDGDPTRFDGQGVLKAVQSVSAVLGPECVGLDAVDQVALDRRLLELDGSPHKSRLGANAILGISLANAQAAAVARRVDLVVHLLDLWQQTALPAEFRTPGRMGMSDASLAPLGQELLLPLPMVNMISGGLHAGRNLDLQDFLILPVGAGSYREALGWIVSIYRRLGEALTSAGCEGVLVGDEGGYGPRLTSNEMALSFLTLAIEQAGLRPGIDVALGLDVASTHFFDAGRYLLRSGGDVEFDSAGMVDLLDDWSRRYPLISVEDGCAEDDWDGWNLLTNRLGGRLQLIGDDLFVTNPERLKRGVERGCANSVLIKLNQIGSLTETLVTLRMALSVGYWPVVSARSGETEDSFIAVLAVATGAGQIKIGSVARSERLAKYNQLLRLEEKLGSRAGYAGGKIFRTLRGHS